MDGIRRGVHRRTRGSIGLWVAVCLAVGGTAHVAEAQESATPRSSQGTSVHPEAADAIDRIRSPFCPGLMLEVCSSSGAAVLRDSIQTLAENGLRADSIVELVIAEYGEEWRAVPRAEGAGVWAWLLPPFFLVGGVLLVWATLRARAGRRGERPSTNNPDPREMERLRSALDELEQTERPDW